MPRLAATCGLLFEIENGLFYFVEFTDFLFSGPLMEIEDIPSAHKTWVDRFDSFKTKHAKKYATPAEHGMRKGHFINNFRLVVSCDHFMQLLMSSPDMLST